MSHILLIYLILISAAWAIQAVLSTLQVRKQARLFEQTDRNRFDSFRPQVSVVVPFKGIDPDLPSHIRSLFEQDYPHYDLLLVVDSDQDPSYPMLKKELIKYPHRKAQILIAGSSSPHEGQKIHNMLFAIDQLTARSTMSVTSDWAWVFADSDAVPGPRWLADLVGPLGHERNGLTFGYRWLIPAPHKKINSQHASDSHPLIDNVSATVRPPTIWSQFASVMNSSVACFYKSDAYNQAWGGSMAVLAKTAIKGDLRGRLTGALCDDFQFTRMCRELGLRVYFVLWCLVATPVDFTFSQLVNFAHRQYLLTRVYAPKLFTAAALITTLYVAGLVSTWGWFWAGVTGLAEGADRYWYLPAAALITVFLANQARAKYRQHVILQAFGSDGLSRLRTALWWDRWATPIWMTLHWLLIVRSAFGRTMNWRGIRYRLLGPQHVVRLDSQLDSSA